MKRFYSFLLRACLFSASPQVLADFVLEIVDNNNQGRRTVADIDGDGFNDIVVHRWAMERGTTGDGELSWYRYPDWRKSIIANEKNFFGDYIEAVDLDNDGDIDVIAPQGKDGIAKLYWYENLGNQWKENFLGEVKDGRSEAKDILVDDFDKDGRTDIAVRTDSIAGIFFQNSPQNFILHTIAIVSHEGATKGDVDGDSYTDLIFNGYWIRNPGEKARTDDWKRFDIDPIWFDQNSGGWRDNSVRAQFADFNRDGKKDVVFTHSEKNAFEFAWYENRKPTRGVKGWIKHSLPKQSYAHTLLARDYDLDGDLDLITAGTVWNDYNHQRKGDTRLWENNGKGEFTSRTISDQFNYVGVPGDIDNDGDQDIVGTLAWDRPPIYLLRNKISVSANSWRTIQVDDKRHKFGAWNKDYEWLRYFGLDAADVDGDGDKDAISGRYYYQNTSRGWKRFDIGENVDGWVFVDVDGDDYSDALGFAGPKLFWLEADCAGAKKCAAKKRGEKWSVRPITLAGEFIQPDHFNPQGVRVKQIVAGGRFEVSFEGADGLYVLQIPTDTESSWPINRITDFTGDGHDWGDLDGDGGLDLVTTSSKSPHQSAWYRNPGRVINNTNKLWEKVVTIGEMPHAPDRYSLADMDGDKDLDLVVGMEVYPVGSAKTDVLLFINPGSETGFWQKKVILKDGESVNSLQVADMDFDGDTDIVLGEMGGDQRILVLENNGGGDFSRQHMISLGKEIHGLIVEDIDMDGDKDAMAISWDNYPNMYYFQNLALENRDMKKSKQTANSKKKPLKKPKSTRSKSVKKFDQVTIMNSYDEGMDAFKISTPLATWYLQKKAGGFSSLIDSKGRDWISFNGTGNDHYPMSAAGRYRGIPNMVHGTDDAGVSHPGFAKCTSTFVPPNRISVESNSGLWRFQYLFFNTHVELRVLQSDPNYAYWFLYEGTPGGRFRPTEQYWGNSNAGPLGSTPDFIKGAGVYDQNWRWAYFGDTAADNIFFAAHAQLDSLSDQFSYMGNDIETGIASHEGMTVFGFGRSDKPLLQGYNVFYFGLMESKVGSAQDHARVKRAIEAWY